MGAVAKLPGRSARRFSQRPEAGGAAFINPGDFAGYVFTIVAGIGAVGLIGAVARRIGGSGRRPQRVVVSRDGVSVIPLPESDTDAGRGAAVERLAGEVESLRDEMAGLRRDMDETLNRLDFTERLLTQARERGLLNAPKETRPSQGQGGSD